MTEEQRIKQSAQLREFPETLAILTRVRDKLAEQVFLTPISAQAIREDLYTRVQALDALKVEISTVLAQGAGDDAIQQYVEKLATTER